MVRARFAPRFAPWRRLARRLLHEGVPPESILWTPGASEQASLALSGREARAASSPSGAASADGPRVPRRFLELAEIVADHRDPERWALLYRVLWRLCDGEPHLLRVATDPDVHRLLRLEKAVRRSAHKMKAFVRFRSVEDDDGSPRYVAWFEPEHDVLRRCAPFFAERFASMRWSILTPDGCAHWDGEQVRFTAPVPRDAAPDADGLEALWRTYYAHTFNPARARPRAMRAEMPARYWKHLPEAEAIPELLRDAPRRVREMVERERE